MSSKRLAKIQAEINALEGMLKQAKANERKAVLQRVVEACREYDIKPSEIKEALRPKGRRKPRSDKGKKRAVKIEARPTGAEPWPWPEDQPEGFDSHPNNRAEYLPHHTQRKEA